MDSWRILGPLFLPASYHFTQKAGFSIAGPADRDGCIRALGQDGKGLLSVGGTMTILQSLYFETGVCVCVRLVSSNVFGLDL